MFPPLRKIETYLKQGTTWEGPWLLLSRKFVLHQQQQQAILKDLHNSLHIDTRPLKVLLAPSIHAANLAVAPRGWGHYNTLPNLQTSEPPQTFKAPTFSSNIPVERSPTRTGLAIRLYPYPPPHTHTQIHIFVNTHSTFSGWVDAFLATSKRASEVTRILTSSRNHS